MAEKTTDKQKKEDILDTDLEYLINEEEKLQEKLKDSSHLERFAKDLMLFMSLIKDYYHGNYRDIPYKTISAGVVGLDCSILSIQSISFQISYLLSVILTMR